LVLAESIYLSFFGGIAGIFSAFCFLHFNSFSIGNEGLVLAFVPTQEVLLGGVIATIALGLLSGIYPAWRAGGNSISDSLRAR
jgi:ABC-type antimicrobial peptide transport system permease subunit